MSQPQRLQEGVYKQGDEVIVVLPSDKVVIIEEVAPQVVVSQTREKVEHHSPLQTIQQKIHHLFDHKQTPEPVVVVETAVIETPNTEPWDLEIRNFWRDCRQRWRTLDSDAAFCMTEFKRQYVLPVGDIPVRSVCMAVSTGLTYAIFGRRNPQMFARTRNLALSFLINGSFWLPQLFNPFLVRQHRI